MTVQELKDAIESLDIGEPLKLLMEVWAVEAEEDGEDVSERVYNALEEEIRNLRLAQGACKDE